MAAINTSIGVIVLVAVLVTGTEGGRCPQEATDAMVTYPYNTTVNFDDVNFGDKLTYKHSTPDNSIDVLPNIVLDPYRTVIEFLNDSSFGIYISPYGLYFSEINGISVTITTSNHVDTVPSIATQAEDIISCGFTNASDLKFVFVVNFEGIAITQVSMLTLSLCILVVQNRFIIFKIIGKINNYYLSKNIKLYGVQIRMQKWPI